MVAQNVISNRHCWPCSFLNSVSPHIHINVPSKKQKSSGPGPVSFKIDLMNPLHVIIQSPGLFFAQNRIQAPRLTFQTHPISSFFWCSTNPPSLSEISHLLSSIICLFIRPPLILKSFSRLFKPYMWIPVCIILGRKAHLITFLSRIMWSPWFVTFEG